ncbi:hypothetical protein BJY52DRAFT_27577 [Lactarius psammicola]|nr:hypothetical protein BJY52DRAFT_27577 [Lactarius psammicola]
MPFLPRNSYYLRVSSSWILPLYVYLDNEHVDWMSDRVLNRVVADLRPKIVPKLRAESDAYMGAGPAPANAKKGTVDVHRGDTYQFAYFLRETEPHSVLIKTRNFVLDTTPPLPPSSRTSKPQEKEQKKSSSTRKRHGSPSRTKKRASRKRKAVRKNNEGDDLDYSPSDSEFSEDHVLGVGGGGDIEMAEGSDSGAAKGVTGTNKATADLIDVKVEEDERGLPQTVSLTAAQKSSHAEDAGAPDEMREDDEQKPKLALELKYRSFSNFNRCLCVVVEPWPPLRRDTRAPWLAPSAAAEESSRVPAHSKSRDRRGKTPLFLPDFDDERATPGPSHGRTLPPVPLFDNSQADHDVDETEDLGDSAAIMQFSQLLNTTGRVTGAIEEDDEFDGAALFADADEAKEL